MQTRRLRLGDVVDDYCPRERRLSNHVVVAMIEDTIKQTRCATCDFEHLYKEAKVPARRKKKDDQQELFQQVLDNVTEGMTLTPDEPDEAPPVVAAAPPPPPPPVPKAVAPKPKGVLRPSAPVPREATASGTPRTEDVKPVDDVRAAEVAAAAAAAADARPAPARVIGSRLTKGTRGAKGGATTDTGATPADANVPVPLAAAPADGEAHETSREEDAPLHRRALIRATLPRPVGEVPVRQIPSFTIREAAAARPNKFRFKGRPPGGRPPRPQGASPFGNQSARPGNGGRGPQGRGAGKKVGGAQPQRAGGHQAARGPKGPPGNKRFK